MVFHENVELDGWLFHSFATSYIEGPVLSETPYKSLFFTSF